MSSGRRRGSDGGDRPRQARRRRAELRQRRRPDLRACRRRSRCAGRGGARRHGLDPFARGADRRRHRAPRGSHAPSGGPRRSLVTQPGVDARLLRAPVGHVGATGDDQGSVRGRRPVDRLGVRGGRGAVRVPGGPRNPRDRRRPPHEGSAGGVHPPSRQGAHRGEARPRRHPRCGVRGATAADRAWASRPGTASTEHVARAGHARGGGIRRAGRRRGARRRLSVPAPARASSADRPRPADARSPRGSARAHHARSFARAGRCRCIAGRVRTPDRVGPRDPRAAVLPAAARGVRGSGGAESRRGPSGDRGTARRTGVRVDVAVVRGAATTGRSAQRGWARCWHTCSR